MQAGPRDTRSRALALAITAMLALCVLALCLLALWLALGSPAMPYLVPDRGAPRVPIASGDATARARDGGLDAEPHGRMATRADPGMASAIERPDPSSAPTVGAPAAVTSALRGEAAIRASCEQQSRARCAAYAQCGCDESDLADTWTALVTAGVLAEGDVPTGDCESAAISECTASLGALRALVPRFDEVTPDRAREEACLRAIEAEASSCGAWAWPLDCALSMTLTLDPDGSCAEGVELCPGGVCDPSRVCVPEPREGERCVQGFLCGAGHVCDGDVCVRRRSRTQGARCATSDACELDLVCSAGACVARGPVGARCAEDTCETGLVCDARQHRCRAPTERCADDLDCGARRVCVERGGESECRPARCVLRPEGPL